MSAFLMNLARRGAGLAPVVRSRPLPPPGIVRGEDAGEPAAPGASVPPVRPAGAPAAEPRSVPAAPAPAAQVVQRAPAAPVAAAPSAVPAAGQTSPPTSVPAPRQPRAPAPPARAEPTAAQAPTAPAASPQPVAGPARRPVAEPPAESPAARVTVERPTAPVAPAPASVREVRERVERVERVTAAPVRVEPGRPPDRVEPSIEAVLPLPQLQPEPRVTDDAPHRPDETPTPAIKPALTAGVPAPPDPVELERRVLVRIGAIEINAGAPAATPAALAPPLPAATAPVEQPSGFDEYARLRSYAPWEW